MVSAISSAAGVVSSPVKPNAPVLFGQEKVIENKKDSVTINKPTRQQTTGLTSRSWKAVKDGLREVFSTRGVKAAALAAAAAGASFFIIPGPQLFLIPPVVASALTWVFLDKAIDSFFRQK